MYKRKFFHSNGLQLSYLDFGGNSDNILLTLHGHFGTGSQFSFLADHLHNWRLLSLDQRGHGWSDHALDLDYSRKSYLEDLYHFIQFELNGKPIVILGHSLGGSNAYQFASKHPDLVRGLIIEDIGAENSDDLSFAQRFPHRTATMKEMKESIEKQLGTGAFPYFAQSINEYEDGWGFRFHTDGLIRSQELLNGSWWDDWNHVACPTIVLRGGNSPILSRELASEMVKRRPSTILAEFPDCAHTIHSRDTQGFCNTVIRFLNEMLQ